MALAGNTGNIRIFRSLRVQVAAIFTWFLLLSVIFAPSCSKQTGPVIIATGVISEITSSTAVSGGTIVYGDNNGITGRGLVWDTLPDPSVSRHAGKLNSEGSDPVFRMEIQGLRPETVYYVRSWASHSGEVAYGNEFRFKTFWGSVTDIDGNTYNTLRAAGLEWTAANLSVSRYNNGDVIPNPEGVHEWRSATEGAWTYYFHDDKLGEVYGKLYNFHAVADERGICPAGWEVPSDRHWQRLETELGMSAADAGSTGLRDRYAGGSLKATGTVYWRDPNTLATDRIGFSALPGGYRHPDGRSYMLRRSANFWTSTTAGEGHAWYRNISSSNGGVYRHMFMINSGFSVRCIRQGD
ncbi:MAG: hypothetical protein EA408_05835 [Marinilabiliales bacterium]|nr:MAG: hypothetical protein EA408_05835 [Marinilabiliales bacterium]